jgi:hypothetical protein
MILSCFGLVDASPVEISEILKTLHMSHTFVGGGLVGRTLHHTIDGLSYEQPVWPIVIDRIPTIQKVRTEKDRRVYFVCDSRAALALSNVSQALWPEHRTIRLDHAVRNALIASNSLTQPWHLSVNEPRLEDYVSQAAKPSFLNEVLSAIYRITPYAKRKEIQGQCIAFLASGLSFTVLRRHLRSSLKFSELQTLMESDKAQVLKGAVARATERNAEDAAKEYGVDTFDIMYVIKSSAQNKG